MVSVEESPQRRIAKLKARRQKLDEIAATAGVAPFIVVPGKHLDAIGADDARIFRINNRGMRISAEIHGNQFFLGVFENSLHGAFGSLLERRIHALDGGGFSRSSPSNRQRSRSAWERALSSRQAFPSIPESPDAALWPLPSRWESSKAPRHAPAADPCAEDREAAGHSYTSGSSSSCRR